jgi:xanthine dehydrogenase accessory factor
VLDDGSTLGSTGTDDLDDAVRERAVAVLKGTTAVAAEVQGGFRVFFDVLTAEAKLLVCGAGHIAVPLARYAHDAGFRVTVLDDRPDFAHAPRFPNCDVVAEDFVPALRAMPLGPTTHVVLITRGHEHDAECLAQVLPKETAYVGLIGSRRRVRFVLEMLEREGIPRERLAGVFTPIGLPIGAETPEEIALAIVAELVCVRRQGPELARALRGVTEGSS